MTTHPSGSGQGGELDGDSPGCGRVVAFSGQRGSLARARRAEAPRESACGKIFRIGAQFTAADHATLAAWAGDIGHGYDRLSVEQGMLEDGTWASYALVYVPGQAWSTWGVVRRGDHLEVWRCANGATVGRHVRMANALASLPHAADHRRPLPAITAAEPECASDLKSAQAG